MTRPQVRLLSLDDLAALPPAQPLVTKLLPRGGTFILTAPPGTGKSTLALDLSLSLASETPWLGEAVATGPVIYVSGEGLCGLRKRIDAWFAVHPTVDRHDTSIRFVTEAINLLNQAHVAALLASCTGMAPVLVVLDTLARCFGGGDENSASDMGKAIAASDRLRAATGSAVLLLHHPPKGKTDARGSGALLGAVDTAMELASEDGGVLRLTCTKAKDAERFAPRALRLRPVVLPDGDSACVVQLVEGSAGVSRPSRLTAKQQHALETLTRLGAAGATYTAWWNESGLAPTTLDHCRTRLVDDLGLVVKREGRYFAAANSDATPNLQLSPNGPDLGRHTSYPLQPPHSFRSGGGGGGGGSRRGGRAEPEHAARSSAQRLRSPEPEAGA